MTPREIIAIAWAITQREKDLRKWGFFSSFFETLLNLKLISYQFYFLYEFWNGGSAGFFDVEIHIYNSMPHWFFWTFIILLTLLFVIELFVPHLALGAIVGLAAKSHKGEEVKGGLVLALYNFFPIFAIHESLFLANWGTVITACSVVARYVDGDIKYWMIFMICLFWGISNLLAFFFSFAIPAVVIDKQGVFSAIGQSFKLIVSYLTHIMFLLLLLFIISIRIVLNTLIVLIMPAIVIGIAILFTFVLSPAISYTIAFGIGMVLVLVASYFFGYLHVFQQTVWTVTYMELKKNKDLDVIG